MSFIGKKFANNFVSASHSLRYSPKYTVYAFSVRINCILVVYVNTYIVSALSVI